MTIIDTIKRLIKGSPAAEEATRQMIDALATEAIKTGSPDALVAVAAQWEQLLEGRALAPAPEQAALAPSVAITTANDMKPSSHPNHAKRLPGRRDRDDQRRHQKTMNRHVMANGGWKDGDVVDNDPAPGIQPRWSTLSQALVEMRKEGDISNDAAAWHTHTKRWRNIICRCLALQITNRQLTSGWEVIESVHHPTIDHPKVG